MKAIVLAALATLATGAAAARAETAPPAMLRAQSDSALALLQARVAATAQAGAAHVGLAAVDLASGGMVSVNGGERFPMASTVKVAIAAAFLHGVEQGRLSLDASYAMPAAERRLAARVADMRRDRGMSTGAALIDRMLILSDNRAADILLGAIGGTAGVERWLRQAGVSGQRVDRSIAELLSERVTTKRVRIGHGRHRRTTIVTVPRATAPGDQRDSSTPEAMAALLVKLRDGMLLDQARTSYLFDVMSRCRTGSNRIRGLLPPGTPVAHKTGTLDGVTDDVGIVNLPNGHQLAVAVFVRGSGGVAAHDRSIALLARQLYDGFAAADETASARAPGWWGLAR